MTPELRRIITSGPPDADRIFELHKDQEFYDALHREARAAAAAYIEVLRDLPEVEMLEILESSIASCMLAGLEWGRMEAAL